MNKKLSERMYTLNASLSALIHIQKIKTKEEAEMFLMRINHEIGNWIKEVRDFEDSLELTAKGFMKAIKESSLYGKKFDTDKSPKMKLNSHQDERARSRKVDSISKGITSCASQSKSNKRDMGNPDDVLNKQEVKNG